MQTTSNNEQRNKICAFIEEDRICSFLIFLFDVLLQLLHSVLAYRVLSPSDRVHLGTQFCQNPTEIWVFTLWTVAHSSPEKPWPGGRWVQDRPTWNFVGD